MVPLAGIEPALLAESDFESDASTSSAIGARALAFTGSGAARSMVESGGRSLGRARPPKRSAARREGRRGEMTLQAPFTVGWRADRTASDRRSRFLICRIVFTRCRVHFA